MSSANVCTMSDSLTHEQPESFPTSKAVIRLRGPAGMLEAIADIPLAGDAVPAVAVICHPHPPTRR